jgi:hypothetical protein
LETAKLYKKSKGESQNIIEFYALCFTNGRSIPNLTSWSLPWTVDVYKQTYLYGGLIKKTKNNIQFRTLNGFIRIY